MRTAAPKIRMSSSRVGILLLALLVFRAYIPAGFMPASGVPFALQLCPAATAGMPAHLHHHAGIRDTGTHDHAGTHADFESCPFGSVPGAGPISHYIDFESVGPAPSQPIIALEAPRLTHRAERSHPPRGPPSLA
jgi:hypothetical protein